MTKFEIGQEVWFNRGEDSSVSFPFKGIIVGQDVDYYTIAFYDDHEVWTLKLYVLDIYPTRESLIAEYNKMLDRHEEEFEREKHFLDNYKK